MAVSAMKEGKHAAIEVPAALTLDECWELVDTAEQKRRHCIMLENCCYGEIELLVLRMARQGVLGELTHGEAGYLHESREYLLQDSTAASWRRRFVATWNGNLYPTHGLGPVGEYMGIHAGDKFDYLVSMSSLEQALSRRCESLPADNPHRREHFACGDMNTTLIKTAVGRTIARRLPVEKRSELLADCLGCPPPLLQGTGVLWHETGRHPLRRQNAPGALRWVNRKRDRLGRRHARRGNSPGPAE